MHASGMTCVVERWSPRQVTHVTPCVGSFTSPGRRAQQLLVSHPKGKGKVSKQRYVNSNRSPLDCHSEYVRINIILLHDMIFTINTIRLCSFNVPICSTAAQVEVVC